MTSEQSLVDAGLRTWRLYMDRAGKFFGSLSAEDLQLEVAPNRNRLIYIWGHLTAVNDAIFPLFAFGSKHFPELAEIFFTQPDRSVEQIPDGADLKRMWTEVDVALWQEFQNLSPSEWLQRHQGVSEEDFGREPHRNRFASLLGRSAHVAYHLGQAMLAKQK